jgi:hypothetical protein
MWQLMKSFNKWCIIIIAENLFNTRPLINSKWCSVFEVKGQGCGKYDTNNNNQHDVGMVIAN